VNIRKILQCANIILETPVALIDTDNNLLGCTQNQAGDDILWDTLMRNKKLRQDALSFDVKNANIVFLNDGNLKYEAAVIKLFERNGTQAGSLIVTASGHPFLARDIESMELISDNLLKWCEPQTVKLTFF